MKKMSILQKKKIHRHSIPFKWVRHTALTFIENALFVNKIQMRRQPYCIIYSFVLVNP